MEANIGTFCIIAVGAQGGTGRAPSPPRRLGHPRGPRRMRAAASAAAKQALLAKFKPKPMVTAPVIEDRNVVREAELAAVRALRAEAKAAKEAARLAAEAAVVEAEVKLAEDSDEARRAEPPRRSW